MLENGHTAQNLNLVAVALGGGSVNLVGFHDAELAECLGSDYELETPLYAVDIGSQAEDPGNSASR